MAHQSSPFAKVGERKKYKILQRDPLCNEQSSSVSVIIDGSVDIREEKRKASKEKGLDGKKLKIEVNKFVPSN